MNQRELRTYPPVVVMIRVVLAEIAAAMVPTVLLALVVVPLARAERGHEAFGGEWMLIGAVFVVTYCAAHRWAYHKIFWEGKHG